MGYRGNRMGGELTLWRWWLHGGDMVRGRCDVEAFSCSYLRVTAQ